MDVKVLGSLQNLCSKRECCSPDIYKKALKALDGDADAAREMVDALIADRFIDDARYASAFAREKSALTGWGPAKIRHALRMKGIDGASISAALGEVDEEAADQKMLKVIQAKAKLLEGDEFIKFKLIKFALSRGYDYDKVEKAVTSVLKERY